MGDLEKSKNERVLTIYTELQNGYLVSKAEAAQRFGVDERTIQRDIDNIRTFLDGETERTGIVNVIKYDRTEKGFRMEQLDNEKLSNAEILAICKILLDSRAFPKKEMQKLLQKLVAGCVPLRNQKIVSDLIRNEEFHYIELRHHKEFLNSLWELGTAIQSCSYVELSYTKLKGQVNVKRKIKPLAITFSEFYFYLIAMIDDPGLEEYIGSIYEHYPTIYRIDRIRKLKVLNEHFRIPYRDRFEEGEYRKRVQFMYGGKLRRVKFRYTGLSIEAVLDRLPTAKILEEGENGYVVEAEVFGEGIDMWLRSQGENVTVL